MTVRQRYYAHSCRPEECRVKTPVRQSIPGVLREKMERVYRIRADTLVCCGCVLLKLHGKAQMATRWKALETALNDTLRL